MSWNKRKIGKWIYVLLFIFIFALALYLLSLNTFPKRATNSPFLTLNPTATARPVPEHTPLPTSAPFIIGQKEVFNDLNPDTQLLELWRIKHNWQVTASLAYHFQDPFSFDGRYLVSQQDDSLHIFDLRTNQVIKVIASGSKPTWARHSHQLFYYDTHKVYRYDVKEDKTVIIVEGKGAGYPRTISRDDRYILTAYGGFPGGQDRSNTGEIYRIENKPKATIDNGQVVQLTDEWQYASEPRASSQYDIIVFKQRESTKNIEQGWWAMRFDSSLNENRQSAQLLDKDFSLGSHAAWLGEGEHFIMGNENPPKQIRYSGDGEWGRWEPIGSTNISAGDVAPMGYSGQWLVVDVSNESHLTIIDMQSEHLTLLAHYPSEIIDKQPGDENRGDPNPHGSPDGTKVAFVSNYDLKNCPTTHLTGQVTDYVPVQSTAGFPEEGVLAIRHHLVSYASKTSESFEDITVGALDTESAVEATWPGIVVTDFGCRSSSITDLDHQYRQDLYVAVYRLPDIPNLSVSAATLTIIPGENHREIMGYKLHGPHGTIRRTSFPAKVYLAEGEYAVSAVEWSGLESMLSKPVFVPTGAFELVLR